MILIYTVVKNKSEANKIAKLLLKLKLIACANSWPIDSVYTWHDKIVSGKEVAMLLKTRKSYYKKIESLIKKIHSYEKPCILVINPDKVDNEYLSWLKQVTRLV